MTIDVERLARKLEPMMPDRIQHWFRVRATADAELKSLLDKQIVTLAYAHLGNFREKLLLSLPAAERAKGEIHLGTILYETPKWPLGVSRGELLQNMAILGRSGSGKTNLLFEILRQLDEKRIPFIMFDWKRTGRALLPFLKNNPHVYTPGRSTAPLRFNPFTTPPGMEKGVHGQLLVDTIAEAFTLGDGARSLLLKAILQCTIRDNTITAQHVIDSIEAMTLRHREHGWRASALRALRGIVVLQPESADDAGQSVRALMLGSTIIELDALGDGGRRFLVPMLSLSVYHTLLASPDRERLMLSLAIDEAHHFLYSQNRARETVMERLLRQGREIGLGTIVLDQNPHLLSAAALGNVFATVCLNQQEPKDLNKVASLSQIEDTEKDWLGRLPVGHAIVRLADRWTQPILIQVPLVDVRKGSVSDHMLDGQSANGGSRPGTISAEAGQLPQVPQNSASDMLLDEGLLLLHDVLTHPGSGVRERYARLGLAASSGHRLKERLLRGNWLESSVVPEGRTRRVLLRLTAGAQSQLGLPNDQASPSPASLIHEYWKRRYADMLKRQGFDVEIEPSRNGRCDLLGVRNGKNIAVEIETGRSDFVANVRRDLRAGYRVYVVAVTRRALGRIEHLLTRARLMIPGRVCIIQAPTLPPIQ